MSFQPKTDYFGLATSATGLVLTDATENNATEVATGQNEKGDIVAYVIGDEQASPTCTYILSKDMSLEGIEIGKAVTSGSRTFAFAALNIQTAAGSPPRIEVNGQQGPSDTTHTDCYYTVPTATLQQCHHAQTLWSAFSVTGDGCYLT